MAELKFNWYILIDRDFIGSDLRDRDLIGRDLFERDLFSRDFN